MTADEIHQLGLSEVARIHGEMEKMKNRGGLPGHAAGVLRASCARTSSSTCPTTMQAAQEYIDLATKHIKEMKLAKLPEYFGILPKADLVVKRVEPFREEPGGAQHYFPGTPDGTRPGIYYAHLSDMNAMPTYMLEVIAYHEGLPGHHMQISIAQELTSGPNKLRSSVRSTATPPTRKAGASTRKPCRKRWDSYQDPYSDFGRLGSEIWRAIRLVVDTGIHSKGWTEEQAVKYFLDNSAIAEGAAASEVRRYIVTAGPGDGLQDRHDPHPAAACDKARTELGDKFNIRLPRHSARGRRAAPSGSGAED
jgi:uncharacterized protein (DUF885 family)